MLKLLASQDQSLLEKANLHFRSQQQNISQLLIKASWFQDLCSQLLYLDLLQVGKNTTYLAEEYPSYFQVAFQHNDSISKLKEGNVIQDPKKVPCQLVSINMNLHGLIYTHSKKVPNLNLVVQTHWQTMHVRGCQWRMVCLGATMHGDGKKKVISVWCANSQLLQCLCLLFRLCQWNSH